MDNGLKYSPRMAGNETQGSRCIVHLNTMQTLIIKNLSFLAGMPYVTTWVQRVQVHRIAHCMYEFLSAVRAQRVHKMFNRTAYGKK